MGTGITTSIRYHPVVSAVPRNPATSALCLTTASTNGTNSRDGPVRALAALWPCHCAWDCPGTMAGRSATICARTAYPGDRLWTTKPISQEKETLPCLGTSSSIDTPCHPCFSRNCKLLLLL